MKSLITGRQEPSITHQPLSLLHLWQPETLRMRLVNHILKMKQLDETYARYALKQYNTLLPDMKLNYGVRDALKGVK